MSRVCLGQFCSTPTLGRDETAPSGLINKVINPTDFDEVANAMRLRIREQFKVPVLSTLAWALLGVGGEPIRAWLMRYIITASEWKLSYAQSDWPKWREHFMKTYGYSEEVVTWYFRTFRQLRQEAKVPETVFAPFAYIPEDDPGLLDNLRIAAEKTAKTVYWYLIGAAAVGTIAYVQLTKTRKS